MNFISFSLIFICIYNSLAYNHLNHGNSMESMTKSANFRNLIDLNERKLRPLKDIENSKKVLTENNSINQNHSAFIANFSHSINLRSIKKFSTPYLVRIYLYNPTLRVYETCSGTIINKKTILTTAHCLEGKDIQNSILVAGSRQTFDCKDLSKISKIIYHGDFIRNDYSFDLALILLAKPLIYNKDIRAIKISEEGLNPGETLSVKTQGIDMIQGEKEINVISAPYKLVKETECPSLQRSARVIKSVICAVPQNLGMCVKDVGGPVVKNNLLVGMFLGPQTDLFCGSESPRIILKIGAFKQWINNYESRSNMVF